jgi:hypothetical protein
MSLKNKREAELFNTLLGHMGHKVEIQDTTNHDSHISEMELVCVNCGETLIRADNPDGDIY